jgi:hypothetical protein
MTREAGERIYNIRRRLVALKETAYPAFKQQRSILGLLAVHRYYLAMLKYAGRLIC